MPPPPSDLHGNVPDNAAAALLIIDMINAFTFDGAERLFPAVTRAAEHIAELKARATAARIPTIYVNDNFGKWRSDFHRLVAHCIETECRGKPIAELLRPTDEDYFVLKPKHSGFFGTPLELLLKFLGTRRLILTGVAGDNCVLYTAADAYMREFELYVPENCTASIDAASNSAALGHMRTTLKANTQRSTSLRLTETSCSGD
jgi:nicotinamidase-related amidase